MSEEIPQEFSRQQFEERGVEVTDGEVRAVNHYVHEMEQAFETGEARVFFVDDGGEDYGSERMTMLIDFARNFLRDD